LIGLSAAIWQPCATRALWFASWRACVRALARTSRVSTVRFRGGHGCVCACVQASVRCHRLHRLCPPSFSRRAASMHARARVRAHLLGVAASARVVLGLSADARSHAPRQETAADRCVARTSRCEACTLHLSGQAQMLLNMMASINFGFLAAPCSAASSPAAALPAVPPEDAAGGAHPRGALRLRGGRPRALRALHLPP